MHLLVFGRSWGKQRYWGAEGEVTPGVVSPTPERRFSGETAPGLLRRITGFSYDKRKTGLKVAMTGHVPTETVLNFQRWAYPGDFRFHDASVWLPGTEQPTDLLWVTAQIMEGSHDIRRDKERPLAYRIIAPLWEP